ncbi:MAG: hypothetical protein ABRQ27_11180, partial [Clostridiaceae bacterium]
RRFMQGRYGVDDFSRFLITASIILILLAGIIKNNFVNVAALAIVGFAYYRILSKNHFRCSVQNQKYLRLKNKVTGRIKMYRDIIKQRKTHHIYKCPNCKQRLRIPKGKGKVEITCPKCSAKFKKRS